MRVSTVIEDSIVDGPGLRLAVFTQGCMHCCDSCHNPATHDRHGGYEVEPNKLVAMVARNPLCDGVTLTGGEPFLQAAECAVVASGVKALGKTVWTYSGYTYEELTEQSAYIYNNEWQTLLNYSDVLVDGPFVVSKRSLTLLWRGSENQRIIPLKNGKWSVDNGSETDI